MFIGVHPSHPETGEGMGVPVAVGRYGGAPRRNPIFFPLLFSFLFYFFFPFLKLKIPQTVMLIPRSKELANTTFILFVFGSGWFGY